MHYRNRTPYRQGDVEPAGLYFSYITLIHPLSLPTGCHAPDSPAAERAERTSLRSTTLPLSVLTSGPWRAESAVPSR